MKHLYYTYLLLLTISSWAQSPNWEWFSTPQTDLQMFASAPVIDASGNVYVAYSSYFGTNISIGNYNFVQSSYGQFYIVKYSQNGAILWISTPQQATGQSIISSLKIDNLGNIYAFGKLEGSITLNDNLSLSFPYGVFVFKLDENGTYNWAKGTNGLCHIESHDFALDSNGYIYITGNFDCTSVTFGNITLTRQGIRDIFVVKYDTNGNVVWANNIMAGHENYFGNNRITVDHNNNVFIAGTFYNSPIKLGDTIYYNHGFSDIYLAKYTNSGQFLWGKTYGGQGGDNVNSICTDTEGNILMTGSVTNLAFDTINMVTGEVAFIGKFSPQGNASWINFGYGWLGDDGNDVVTNSAGDVFAVGYYFSPSIDFFENGEYIDNSTLINEGVANSYITKFNANGNFQWVKSIAGDSNNYAAALVLDNQENIYITGTYNGTVRFDNTTFSTPANPNVQYPFLAKLVQQPLTTTENNPEKVTIFPNPANNLLNIYLNNFNDESYEVYDIFGRCVGKGVLSNNQLDISKFPSGIYFLNINNTTTKFIKE